MEMAELTVVASSFTAFQLLFKVASPRLSGALCPGYRHVPAHRHTEWNSRLVSTVHALIVGFFCLYILWFDDAVNEDPVWGDPRLVKLNVGITCGYLLYDLVLLACNWNTIGDSFFVCHHLAALYAYGYVLVVFRGPLVPALRPACGAEWGGHVHCVLPGEDRRHPLVLQPGPLHRGHDGLRAPGPRGAGGLDPVQRQPGHPQRHLDVPDLAGVLPRTDRQPQESQTASQCL
nr:PREDICTED: transmembrane protein 56-B-like isoform X2 [Lepisosteus oculatus]